MKSSVNGWIMYFVMIIRQLKLLLCLCLLTNAAQALPSSLDKQLANLTKNLLDKPYRKGDAGQIGYDCQTLVQTIMARRLAKNQDEIEKYYLQVSYNHYLLPKEPWHYLNRHHFIDADFNKANQQKGFIQDVTTTGELSRYAKVATSILDKQQWLKRQYLHINIKPRVANIFYLPKTSLALLNADGSYMPHVMLFNMIPTPAIVELIYDTNKWFVGRKNIKELIGTDLNVGHMGIVYRERFKQHATIYHKIICDIKNKQTYCQVKPITCNKPWCEELMLIHATSAYPNHFAWYKNKKGDYECSAIKPKNGHYTTCNRVEKKPLFAYLTDYQFGSYWYMDWPAILGIHIEKLL